MRVILAVDAGGTSTRAAAFDPSGRCVGFGRAGAGNPTAAGIEGAVGAIGDAAEAALLISASAHPRAGDGSSAAIALAGEETAAFRDEVSTRLAHLGFGPVTVWPDLLGMFHSGTPALTGYVLIAGTGAVAARVVHGRLERVAGGAGWLLGDAGSGFWIGHRVARAVVADLDRRGQPTRLTGLLLNEVGIEQDGQLDRGSPRTLRRLVSMLYAMRPVELARFAPLAFAADDDPVANCILTEAFAALESLFGAVGGDAHGGGGAERPTAPVSGTALPVVIGGSVLIEGMRLGDVDSLRSERGLFRGIDPIRVSDGVLGAAVLGFRASGAQVDAEMFDRLRAGLAERRRAIRR